MRKEISEKTGNQEDGIFKNQKNPIGTKRTSEECGENIKTLWQRLSMIWKIEYRKDCRVFGNSYRCHGKWLKITVKMIPLGSM